MLMIYLFIYESAGILSKRASTVATIVHGSPEASLRSTSIRFLVMAFPWTSALKNRISFAGYMYTSLL